MSLCADANTRLTAYLNELSRQGFYGAITVKLEGGRITIIKTERNYKPDELPVRPGDVSNGQ